MTPYLHAKLLAVRRRLSHAVGRKFDPFPPPPQGLALSPSQAHFAAYERVLLQLGWDRAGLHDPMAWQQEARGKLVELMGFSPLGPGVEARHLRDHELPDGLRRKSFYLAAGPGNDIPVCLAWREDGPWPRPAMICLQGTNSGMHLSWGEARMPADPIKVANGGDFALQAAARGYLAVCVEQRGFGERAERHIRGTPLGSCGTAANHALMLGATLLGERAADVSTVVGWLVENAETAGVTPAAIHVMGHSSGGSTALFASALDQRIAGVLACGCVGFIRETIARRAIPEGQNTIPGILDWLEMDDIVALCAPRPFLTVAGRSDHIWPFSQAEAVIASARRAYDALGASARVGALAGPGGHRFYPEIAWDAYAQLCGSKGDAD